MSTSKDKQVRQIQSRRKLQKQCLNATVVLCNHSLHIGFDTLENFTLMEGTEQRDFGGLVLGPVSINIISQNCCVQIRIDCRDNIYGDQ